MYVTFVNLNTDFHKIKSKDFFKYQFRTFLYITRKCIDLFIFVSALAQIYCYDPGKCVCVFPLPISVCHV